jgi:hypothetical protein
MQQSDSAPVRGGVHSGFFGGLFGPRGEPSARKPTVYREIVDALDAWDASAGVQHPVYITGHSLGGALSVVFAAALVNDGRAKQIGGVYTFGQPRVGDADLCKSLDAVIRDRVFRYVAGDDLVPRVPPNITRFYEPLGTLVHMRPSSKAPSGVVTTVQCGGEVCHSGFVF